MTTYDENNVPILEREPSSKLGLSADALKTVRRAHAAAQKALEEAPAAAPDDEKAAAAANAARDKHLLLGEAVIVHNADPDDATKWAAFTIGASTLDEAVKDVIGAFDSSHLGPADQSVDHLHTPDWVASTHPALAKLLADYYSSSGHSCAVRELAEVLG